MNKSIKQNYMNPEMEGLPNIGLVKRSLEYQNYLYNQQQLQRKRQSIRRQKQHEIQQSALQNHLALIDLENERIRSLTKKYQVQDTLQRQYQNQIDIHKRVKTEQKSKEKIYSHLQKQLLQSQQINRVYEMTKMYQVGPNHHKQTRYGSRQKRILTEGCQDSLDQLKHQSLNEFEVGRQKTPSVRIEPSLSYQNTVEPKQVETKALNSERNHKNSLPYNNEQFTSPLKSSNQKRYSLMNLDYADYLKREIDRRQKQKQIHKKKELDKDKSWIEDQTQAHYQNVEKMKYFNQKKKHDYAHGLERQLQLKRQYKAL